jgi:hypothetical protein
VLQIPGGRGKQSLKRWQIFTVGVVALLALLFLQAYESVVASLIAIAIIVFVAAGFALTPKRDIFYLRTSVFALDPDGELTLEHDRIAIRIELTRLWLLFVPTFVAVAFLLVTASRGIIWNIDLLETVTPPLFSSNPLMFYAVETFVLIAWIALTGWFYERRVFRDAEAANAQFVSSEGKYLKYSFVTMQGDYYGNSTVVRRLQNRDHELESIVFYNVVDPGLNVIGIAMLFHRGRIIGRGITDLDEATVGRKISEVAPKTAYRSTMKRALTVDRFKRSFASSAIGL